MNAEKMNEKTANAIAAVDISKIIERCEDAASKGNYNVKISPRDMAVTDMQEKALQAHGYNIDHNFGAVIISW